MTGPDLAPGRKPHFSACPICGFAKSAPQQFGHEAIAEMVEPSWYRPRRQERRRECGGRRERNRAGAYARAAQFPSRRKTDVRSETGNDQPVAACCHIENLAHPGVSV